ncbi:hypothetical protein [Microbacterium hydrocarbonoxydans]|uniref:hypothetical protein n=1 Tax=Microbacterium hydrocarbonoxydans TaxID=273678 RepID=UPI0007BB28AE|nr:hypothetical protein [Microbacterium hydrocarbonoxydans]GAT73486.1 hypothetical protein MHM582_1980 [Microbacterium sp. HM58-2]
MSTDLPETPDTENPDAETEFIEDGVLYDDEVTPEYGILGFTLRELLIVGVWAVAFIVSFFPVIGEASVWASGLQWVVPIGLPTAAVFLIVLRRFSPEGIRRVGSLGIDQFASVAFSFSALSWVTLLWNAVQNAVDLGAWLLGWSGIVQLIASLALVVLTVFAPIIPGLREDFQGRLVTLAHRNANPVRPVIPRPRPETAPAAPEQPTAPAVDQELSGQQTTDEIARIDVAGRVPLIAHASGGGTGTSDTTADESYTPSYARRSRGEEIVSDTDSIIALVTPDESATAEESASTAETEVLEKSDAPDDDAAPDSDREADVDLDATNPRRTSPDPQPFWILAATEREVHDERGDVLFTIGPTAWALVIEDRGGAYVVRHDDGRIGYLHDISDITKG